VQITGQLSIGVTHYTHWLTTSARLLITMIRQILVNVKCISICWYWHVL